MHIYQVLNLFLALLLSSFGASNLSGATSEDDGTNKLTEAFRLTLSLSQAHSTHMFTFTISPRPPGFTLSFHFHKLTLLPLSLSAAHQGLQVHTLSFHFQKLTMFPYSLFRSSSRPLISHFLISLSLLEANSFRLTLLLFTFTKSLCVHFHFQELSLFPLSLSRAHNLGLQVHTFTSSFLRPFNFHFSLSQAHQSVQDSDIFQILTDNFRISRLTFSEYFQILTEFLPSGGSAGSSCG